jgi:hypothetical protein
MIFGNLKCIWIRTTIFIGTVNSFLLHYKKKSEFYFKRLPMHRVSFIDKETIFSLYSMRPLRVKFTEYKMQT